MRPFNLIVGLLAIGFAIAQYLAAAGKVRLDVWPFVRTDSTVLRVLGASVWLAIGTVGVLTSL